MLRSSAIVLAINSFRGDSAKTAHGLVRASGRFDIKAVVDPSCAGQDAGELLDGKPRGIRVVATVEEAKQLFPDAKSCVIGMATKGGVLPPVLIDSIKSAIAAGLDVYNGLHDLISSRPELVDLAAHHKVQLFDIRRPPAFKDLHFWTGEIMNIHTPVVAMLGTDCNLGKRTTSRFLLEEFLSRELRAELIYTGQTGWLQGGDFGFIFDCVPNDFVSGELEHSILQCVEKRSPDYVFIEGQSSLCNPSGPCGAEMILSAKARGVVLQHSPIRTAYQGLEALPGSPDIDREVELIRLYGAEILGIVINESGISADAASKFRADFERTFQVPAVLGISEGVSRLVDPIVAYGNRVAHEA